MALAKPPMSWLRNMSRRCGAIRSLSSPAPGDPPGWRCLCVHQAAVVEVVVRGEVEEAVSRVVEEDDPLLAGLLARECLVDRGADGVGGFGGRDASLDG